MSIIKLGWFDMDKSQKIFLIDSLPERKQQLALILSFMEETVITSSTSEWQQVEVDPETLGMIILAEPASEAETLALLAAIHDWAPQVTKLLLRSMEAAVPLTSDKTTYVQGVLPWPLTYTSLTKQLQRCRYLQLKKSDALPGSENHLLQNLVGNSPAIEHVRQLITQVAHSDATVLLLGESGSGKEIAARNIHYSSLRADKPFVAINCGAIPSELLESELFGHEKGAFTGAVTMRKGRFEQAEGGTIFLDEIGDMPLMMQVKLLRVLQERCFERVGGNKSVKVDVRIIAATHRQLEAEIAAGRFREDLYYRLNVFPIVVPPLRDHAADIPFLIQELLEKNQQAGRDIVYIMPSAMEALQQYAWPGNVRELANLIERLTVMYPNHQVALADLPEKFRLNPLSLDSLDQPEAPVDLKEYLVQTELALIHQALDQHDWIVAKAADHLNLQRTTLIEKMRKYKLKRVEGS